MGLEHRIKTFNHSDKVKADDWNDIQDHFMLAWQFTTSSLSPPSELRGATIYYGQFTLSGGVTTLLDDSVDWLKRGLEVYVLTQSGSAYLPKGASYDPNLGTQYWNPLWYTDEGASDAAPPSGKYWSLGATDYLFVVENPGGGDLKWANNSAGAHYAMVWALVTQPFES